MTEKCIIEDLVNDTTHYLSLTKEQIALWGWLREVGIIDSDVKITRVSDIDFEIIDERAD